MKGFVALMAVVVLAGLGFVAGGVHLIHQQHTGERVVATVTDCEQSPDLHGGLDCNGSWVAGGSLLGNGHVVLGPITGVGKSDIGKNVTVIANGDSAQTPSLRLPIILFVVGGLMAFAGIGLAIAGAKSMAAPRQTAAPPPATTR